MTVALHVTGLGLTHSKLRKTCGASGLIGTMLKLFYYQMCYASGLVGMMLEL